MTIDRSILFWFNQFAGRSAPFDKLVAAFTSYAPVLFLILFAVYFFAPGATLRMRRTVVLSGIAGVIALGLVVLLTLFIYRARPFVAFPDQVHLLLPHPADSSFPSDHATGSAAFAAGMWGAPAGSARWLFAIVALFVGLSRLVAGVHWPSDVLGSFVLGSLTAVATFRLARPFVPTLDRLLVRFFGPRPD